MKYLFRYNQQAKKFLRKNAGRIQQEEIANADIKQLEAEWEGYFRLRIRDIRVIFTFEKGEIRIVEVEKIEFRGSIY